MLLSQSARLFSYAAPLHLISEMLVNVVVSLADQLSLGQFNIEVHAEEQSFGELFVALQAGIFDCVPGR